MTTAKQPQHSTTALIVQAMGSGACAMTALAVDPAMLSHFRMLAAALESIERRSESLATKLATAEAEVAVYKER